MLLLNFQAVKDGINAIILQENVRDILSVTLLVNGTGVPVSLNATNPFERLRNIHFLRINLPDGNTLVNGEFYSLTIVYIGNINETPLSRGVFRGSYIDDDGKLQ